MRLLALRGGNLTSLAEPFSLDFGSEPLASAGLFAIIGPTGAGKSTLLDALCLALYDQVPRLGTAGRRQAGTGADAPDAGHSRLAAHDVRQMLRHGAVEGFAEVDFADRAGNAYRARWQVRRARRRPGGRLQAQELLLTRLDTGEALGGSRTETLAAIRDRVGLDFDQFRRSVLLAQGDFDAFLRAQPKDRASLLELITGTEIYGRISQAAHERAKTEKNELQLLVRRIADIQPLPAEERQALEGEHTDATTRLNALTVRHQALRNEADWYRRRDEIQSAIATATTALVEAERAEHAATADREQLERVRRALPLAPLFQAIEKSIKQINDLTGEVVGSERAHAEARAALDRKLEEREAAEQRVAAAEHALAAADPHLRIAAELDTRIATEATHLATAQQSLASAEQALQQTQARLEAATAEQDTLNRRLDALDRWLAGHATDRDLADDPDRIRRDIDALAVARRTASETGARGRTLKEDAAALQATVEAESAAAGSLDREIADLKIAQDEAEATLAAVDLETMRQRRDALQQLRHVLERMADAGGAIATLSERLATFERSVEEARRTVDSDQSTVADLDAAIADSGGRLAAAERQLDLATATDSEAAVRLRARLIPGEPCPVCGATDHAVDAIHARPADQTARVDALRTELEALTTRRTEARERHLLAAATVEGAHGQRATIAADLAGARKQWLDAHTAALTLAPTDLMPSLPDSPAQGQRLAAARAGTETTLAEAETAIRSATELTQHRDRRARALDRLARDRQTHQDAVLEATDRLRQVESELATVESAARESTATATLLAQGLRRALSSIDGWSDLLPSQTEALHRRCREIATGWQDAQGQRQTDAGIATDLTAKIGGLTSAADHALANVAGWRQAVEEQAGKMDCLQSERAGLFGGRATGLVRDELQHALTVTRQALEAARLAAGEAATAEGRLAEILTARRRRLTDAEEDLARVTAERDRLLGQVGLPLAEAEAAIAIGGDWAADTDAKLKTLASDTLRTATVLSERRQQLSEHGARQPELSSDAMNAALAEIEGELEGCRQRTADLAVRLAQDNDRCLQRASAEREAGARQAEAQRWLAVDDLIGSADGSVFRRFAQSLTLDRLLALANRHLAGLAPRYRLQRVPDADMEVQVVDQDMGDEVRSIASLSGGETFLASLALALALATISSGEALADCLFIDEGFGSLDAESLETAVSALEALQATGRRVGVISHVDQIMERISVQVRVHRIAPGRSTVAVVRA